MAYLLDANVFIAAKNLHYGFDFCPAFWEWVIRGNANGKVFSVEKVGDEVLAVADELSEWAAARGQGFFLPRTRRSSPRSARSASGRARRSTKHLRSARSSQTGDYYLVAQALAGKHVVVTHEVTSASVRKSRSRTHASACT